MYPAHVDVVMEEKIFLFSNVRGNCKLATAPRRHSHNITLRIRDAVTLQTVTFALLLFGIDCEYFSLEIKSTLSRKIRYYDGYELKLNHAVIILKNIPALRIKAQL